MTLYEGLSAEKQAVVLDLGSRYTKFGFVGEFSPRCIIPTEIRCPRTDKIRKIFDFENEEDLYSLLVAFIHKLYFKYVLVSPKDRNVVIVESVLSPKLIRDTVANVFFRHYEVPSILFVPSQLAALYALGVRSALVVDVGYNEALIVPVYEGVTILSAWEAQELAGRAVEDRIWKNLTQVYQDLKGASGDAPSSVSTLNLSTLSESVIEDIKVRTCFVTTRDRGEAIADGKPPPEPPLLEYLLCGNEMLLVPGWVRESSCEVIFERDNEEASLADLILKSICKCPIDSRLTLAENIVLVGGTTMLPGFKSRLMEELKFLISSHPYENKVQFNTVKFHSPPAKENYTCWLGGAIFGSTDMIQMRAFTRDNYLSTKAVPDWSNQGATLYLSKLTI